MMKYFVTLTFLFIASQSMGADKQTRKCSFTGLSARCGDAMELVRCEGYSRAYHMLNSQKIKSLWLDAYKGEPRPDREVQKNLLSIESPQAAARDYSIVLAWYGDDIVKGNEITEKSESYNLAISEIQSSIESQGLPGDFVAGLDDLTLGDFEIDAEADLYVNCYSDRGVAPRN